MSEQFIQEIQGGIHLSGLSRREVDDAAVRVNSQVLQRDGVDSSEHALVTKALNVFYGDFLAIRDVNLAFQKQKITAIIGPSGCGKSTLLRALNRMNELVPTARTNGAVVFRGDNIYQDHVDPVEVRRRIGMVFQKPNPFPKSIYENVAWGA
ncbi:MAG: ATP-binding cassette domain-containing protein, partial [Anaerolineales bacterium]